MVSTLMVRLRPSAAPLVLYSSAPLVPTLMVRLRPSLVRALLGLKLGVCVFGFTTVGAVRGVQA